MNRTGRGRPLRFVGIVGLGWIGLRLLTLWPSGVGVPSARVQPALGHAAVSGTCIPHPGALANLRMAVVAVPGLLAARPRGARRTPRLPRPPLPWHAPAPTVLADQTEGAGAASMQVTTSAAQRLPPRPTHPPAPVRAAAFRRWSGSAWLALRPGRGIGSAPGAGQLGGSQLGLRLLRPLDANGRLAASARIAGPVRGPGAEAALGLEWRPLAAPLRLTLEQRIALGRGNGGPSIGMVTGVDRVVDGFRLEAYGQAGMILRDRLEPYADGALRLLHATRRDRATGPAIGIGAWGAAQREAQRLDIGPTVVARLPTSLVHARVALDWRQRIAGRARPGSGMALTLGSDF